MKIVRQRDFKDCGICALASIIEFYGGKVSLEQLRIDARVSLEGTTALNLVLTAQKYGFDASGMKVTSLDEIKILPAIAHMNLKNCDHYVVIYKITKDKVVLMDPMKGKVIKKKKDFYAEWSRIVLVFYPHRKITVLKTNNTLLSIFSKILFSEKKIIGIIIFVSILLTLFTIAGSYYFQIMGNALNNNWDLKVLKLLIMIFGVLVIFKLILTYIRGYLENHLNKNIDCNLNADFLQHLYNLPLEVLTSRTTGEIITRINELNNIKDLISNLFITFSLDFVLMFMAIPLLININAMLFCLLFLAIVLYLFVGIVSGKAIYKKAYQNIEYEADFNNCLVEDMNMINSIKNLGVTNKRLNHLEKTLTRFLYDSFLVNGFLHKVQTFKISINEIIIFLINTFGFYLIYKTKITLVDLITFNMLLNFSFEPIKNIIDCLPKYNFLKATITKINDFLSISKEELGKPIVINDNSITFSNLGYSYNKYEYVINNFNLKINSGEVVAFKGKSGCGKSTICKILDKYIDDYEGDIYIGKINSKDLSISTIRNNILYVNQHENLFSGSIKENILLDRNISNELFQKVCSVCKIDEIVNSKPLRYETIINNDGTNISGGEAQRIILARALLNSFQVLVLDESLSEVDCNLEERIIKNIKKEFPGKTIIYVTHKNHQKNLFDRIINIGGKNVLSRSN